MRVAFKWGIVYVFIVQMYSTLCERYIHMAYISFFSFLAFHIPCSEVRIRDKNLLNTSAPSPVFTAPYFFQGTSPRRVPGFSPAPYSLSDFGKVMLFLWTLVSSLWIVRVEWSQMWKCFVKSRGYKKCPGGLVNTELSGPTSSLWFSRAWESSFLKNSKILMPGTRLGEHLAKNEVAHGERCYHNARQGLYPRETAPLSTAPHTSEQCRLTPDKYHVRCLFKNNTKWFLGTSPDLPSWKFWGRTLVICTGTNLQARLITRGVWWAWQVNG